MQKIKTEIPSFPATSAGLKYFQWLMNMEPEERKTYLEKRRAESEAEKTWSCKTCHDSGFIYHPTTDKNDLNWGKTVICPDCHGVANSLKWVPSRKEGRWEMTFEHWFPTAGTNESLKLAKAWADGSADFLWLLIYGQHGCGKTHLARAAQEVLRRRGCTAAYLYAVSLFDDLRRSLESKTLDDRVRYYEELQYLIIDDLGAEKQTDWTTEKLERILNTRYETYMPVMVTLNGNPDSLPPAIYSRFRDNERSRMSLNKGGDYRSKKSA